MKNKRGIYIGPRRVFGTVKLSLHESGIWRLAYTAQVAAKLSREPPIWSGVKTGCDSENSSATGRIGLV